MSTITSGFSSHREGQRVAEQHPALGVGVGDLDGRAAVHGDDVTGAGGGPDTMFSAIGAKAVTLTGRPSRAMARVAAMTLAAPAMSPFMSTMLEEGLMVRPPESKVTPLPTSARCAVASLRGVGQLGQAGRRGRAVADAEDAAEPISASCSWSNTSSFTLGAPRPLVTSLCAAVTSVGQQRGRAVAAAAC